MPAAGRERLNGKLSQEWFSLNEIAGVVFKRWKFVGVFALSTAVCAAIIALLIPNKYAAKSSILPATSDYQQGGFMAMAEGIPGLELMGLNLGGTSPSALYPEVLKSRQLTEQVLKHEYQYKSGDKTLSRNLYQYFGNDNPDDAYGILRKITTIGYDKKTGIVEVEVTTKSPELSAAVANYYIGCLDDFNMNQRKTGAGMNRDFIAGRISEAETELELAEEELKNFRDSNLNYFSSTDPELLMVHDRLLREVELKKQVFLTLTQQYEIATIQAKKELPVIQVLDRARVPTRKVYPRRMKITFIGLLFGLIVASVLVALEYLYREKYQSRNVREFVTKLRLVNRQMQTHHSEYVG